MTNEVAAKVAYLIFIVPIILSVTFAFVVMADILKEPGRELNMMRFNFEEPITNESIGIIGLQKQYSTSAPIEIQVKINDLQFDCGDLYVTIYSGANAISQNAYFEQCFGSDKMLPTDDTYSEVITTPGNYRMVAEIVGKDQKNISTSSQFTVK